MQEIVCPICHSNQISANQKGFSAGNALIGNMAGGVVTGIGLGMIGSNKIIITCLACGNKFKPGNGTVKTIDEAGKVSFEKQVFVDRDKIRGRNMAIVLLFLLFAFIIAVIMFFNH
jgi:hypothetical protein